MSGELIAVLMGHRASSLDKDSKDICFNAGIGIEIELENVPQLEIQHWDCKEDGSLRNGREFVCSRPYSGVMLKKAINNLSSAMESIDPSGSWRCSTHVHMDMRDVNTKVLKKTLLAYIFYERVMYGCSGMHRYKSNFAPAMAAVQDQLVVLAQNWNREDRDFIDHVLHRWDKYSSLNLKPLSNFGSIELRISEPKWQRENLMLLVNRMLTLKKLAVESPVDETYSQFIDRLVDVGIYPMRDFLVQDYNYTEDDLLGGYVNARDVLSMRSSSAVVYDYVEQAEDVEPVVEEQEELVQVGNTSLFSDLCNHCRRNYPEALNVSDSTLREMNNVYDDVRRNSHTIYPSVFRWIVGLWEEHGNATVRQATARLKRSNENVFPEQ